MKAPLRLGFGGKKKKSKGVGSLRELEAPVQSSSASFTPTLTPTRKSWLQVPGVFLFRHWFFLANPEFWRFWGGG